MGLLSRTGLRVSFSGVASKQAADQEALESEASSSLDGSSSTDGAAETPRTPAPVDAAADVAQASAAPPALAARYRPSDAEVEAVLGLLSEEDRADCDAAMADRYLRATGGDQRHAAKRIHDTLAWRRAEQPEHMVCTACRKDHKSHYMQVVGHDLEGRPLIYSCLALATNRDVEDNRRHMISTFEQAIRLMPQQAAAAAAAAAADKATAGRAAAEGHQQQQQQQEQGQPVGQQGQQPVESWCWVMDFHGFSIRDCDPRLAKIFLNLSAAHYPERLGTFFIVSAPTVFNTLWRAISHFIDPVTKRKIHFVNFSKKDNSKLEGLLARYFDADTCRWLLREMEDNRNKELALRKAYSYPDLSKLVAEGRGAPDVVEAQQARQRLSTCHAHDHLGSPAFLESLEGKPDLLLPHLQQLSLEG